MTPPIPSSVFHPFFFHSPTTITTASFWRMSCFLTDCVSVLRNSYTFDTENMARIMRKRTDDAGQRLGGQVKQQLRTIFETRYRAGKNLWFFSKLRF